MATEDNLFELVVRKLVTRAPLSDADRAAILALPSKRRTFEAGSYLVRDGEPPTTCGMLLSGFAYRHKILSDGSRQIVSIHIPGEILDLQNLFLDASDHNIQTLSRAELAITPREEMQELVRSNPSIGNAILIELLVEASIFREWVVNVGRRDARSRIAHLLCEFGARLRAQQLISEYGYSLPITQEELADATGLTPVHVNRTLKLLQSEGLIERDRRNIRFPAWDRISQVADFNARYLHLADQSAALLA